MPTRQTRDITSEETRKQYIKQQQSKRWRKLPHNEDEQLTRKQTITQPSMQTSRQKQEPKQQPNKLKTSKQANHKANKQVNTQANE